MIYLWLLILSGLLFALSWIDLKSFRLPDFLTFPLIITGLSFGWFNGGNFWEHVSGAVIGYLVFVTIEKTFKAVRGIDGLGRGDAKLLAGGGAWCGVYALPFIVLIGSGMGLIGALFPTIRKSDKVPFGPFLSLGIMITWIVLCFLK